MSTITSEGRWITEPLAEGMVRQWRLDDVIWEGRTAFQHVVIGKTAQGVSLFCDDDRQSTEFSQLTYHEALMVPGLLLADKVDRVLVVGSSEGVVCHMAVAAGATRVDHVDIDEECVRACARHLPYGYTPEEVDAAVAGDGPIKLHLTDGWQFLVDAVAAGEKYDIVLVDLPDEREEFAQHNRLYEAEFLRMARSVLAPGGVVICQAGCQTMWRNTTLIRSWQRFGEVFDTVAYYGSDEHEWAYLFGRADSVADPTGKMVEALPSCGYRPETIDAEALRGNTVPPFLVRTA
ncbi:spermidine synthase [Allokutzneria albata]|uniref:Polyamine aminopropyltransferase n=2 Tax=Allokutzneria albata TaxID=211114 RepID=A0A1G9QZK1_ALLAB|nr:spermidine synthase [Allokutzneria albata]